MGISLFLDGKLWGALTLDALNDEVFGAKARDNLAQLALVIEVVVRVSQLEEENHKFGYFQISVSL